MLVGLTRVGTLAMKPSLFASSKSARICKACRCAETSSLSTTGTTVSACKREGNSLSWFIDLPLRLKFVVLVFVFSRVGLFSNPSHHGFPIHLVKRMIRRSGKAQHRIVETLRGVSFPYPVLKGFRCSVACSLNQLLKFVQVSISELANDFIGLPRSRHEEAPFRKNRAFFLCKSQRWPGNVSAPLCTPSPGAACSASSSTWSGTSGGGPTTLRVFFSSLRRAARSAGVESVAVAAKVRQPSINSSSSAM